MMFRHRGCSFYVAVSFMVMSAYCLYCEVASRQRTLSTKRSEYLEDHPVVLVQKEANRSALFRAQVKYSTFGDHSSSYSAEELERRNEPRRRRNERLNVLFVISDDMRAQLGAYAGPDSEYSKPKLHTPNFDRLAAKSLVLKKAFVQYTYCGPSRTSMLTSRRPDTTGIYGNDLHWRNVNGNFTTLPQYFKQNGYSVQGVGKVYHPGESSGKDDPLSWNEPYLNSGGVEYEYLKPYGPGERWLKVTPEQEEERPLPDRANVKVAKAYLKKAAKRAEANGKPFFLGFGFNKPHVSLICPQKYYDLYPEETGQFLSDPDWLTPRFRPGSGIINGTKLEGNWMQLPTETLTQFRQAYFACVSYVDDLLGELLGHLEELGLAQTTVVSFIADHGYHLGEQNMVGKQTLYDSSSHVPMMIHVPGRTDPGVVSSSVVEALDIFPTIVEAAGLDAVQPCGPGALDIELCTEGTSLMKLVDEPKAEIKPFALTQQVDSEYVMRFSLRNSRYRYTQSFWRESTSGPAVYRPVEPESPQYAMELFDHKTDREERHNVADRPAQSSIMDAMRKSLHGALRIQA